MWLPARLPMPSAWASPGSALSATSNMPSSPASISVPSGGCAGRPRTASSLGRSHPRLAALAPRDPYPPGFPQATRGRLGAGNLRVLRTFLRLRNTWRSWREGADLPKPSPTIRSNSRMSQTEAPAKDAGRDFIRDIIQSDLDAGRYKTIVTRFPPEPNGYLHIGHAKSICLNFGVAEEFGGRCHLRFDDTNPTKEEQEYIDAIKRDVHWLGFDWGEHLHHASDYFQTLYDWAEHLIRAGLAYVDDTPSDEMRAMRGTLTEPGRASPDRDRSVETNLGLFRDMRAGKFPNGACVLRAKIDLASGNINLRDPVLYRILHAAHPRTGTAWCIYPSYDYAHGQSDAIEHVTHSLCTLEFADHRPLYEWFLDHLPVPARPRQTEFARLNLRYTVLSKRNLTELVRRGIVTGWDDPRMPTLAGLRRRGVPAEAIRDFVRRIGMSKANSVVDLAMFDHAIRDHLNQRSEERRVGKEYRSG